MPASAGPAALAESLQLVGRRFVIDAVVDQDHAGGAVLSRIGGFAVGLRVIGVNLAVEHALFVVFLRLVRQHHDEFAAYIYARVIVVVVFRRRDSVPGENHLRRTLCRARRN